MNIKQEVQARLKVTSTCDLQTVKVVNQIVKGLHTATPGSRIEQRSEGVTILHVPAVALPGFRRNMKAVYGVGDILLAAIKAKGCKPMPHIRTRIQHGTLPAVFQAPGSDVSFSVTPYKGSDGGGVIVFFVDDYEESSLSSTASLEKQHSAKVALAFMALAADVGDLSDTGLKRAATRLKNSGADPKRLRELTREIKKRGLGAPAAKTPAKKGK